MVGVKEIRVARELSQRGLAHRAGVAFRTVQLIEAGRHDARLSTLAKLARALRLPGPEALLFSRRTPQRLTAAEAAARIHAEGAETWRLWLFELVDEFRRRPDRSLLDGTPNPDVGQKILALLASTIESLCAERAIRPPWWCVGIGPLEEPWFPAGAESLKAAALVEAPAAFRQRNIFVLGNFLSRA